MGYQGRSLFKYEISSLFPCKYAEALCRIWTWRVRLSVEQRMETMDLKTVQEKETIWAAIGYLSVPSQERSPQYRAGV